MDFFIQFPLHIVEHELFYFQFCGIFKTILSTIGKVSIVISRKWKTHFVPNILWKKSQSAFNIVKTNSVSSTNLS